MKIIQKLSLYIYVNDGYRFTDKRRHEFVLHDVMIPRPIVVAKKIF